MASLMALLLLWALGSASAMGLASSLITGGLILMAPLLAFGMLLGIRLGLLGVAEFFCGMTYLPLKIMSGPYSQNRSYQGMALICSGSGRFAEALKYFRYHEYQNDPFESGNVSAWNERQRTPEILSRLGRDREASALAAHNVDILRRSLADVDCIALREALQCALITAANVVYSAREHGEAVQEDVLQYLQEAIDLGQKPLSLHAAGLKYFYEKNNERAAGAFEECCENIEHLRNTEGTNRQKNSELLGFTQYYLCRCHFKTGQTERVPAILAIMEKENRYEPPASVDKTIVEFTRADYEISLGNTEKAREILLAQISKLSASDAPFDSYLMEAAERYGTLAEGPEMEESLALLRGQKVSQEGLGKSLQQSILALPPATGMARLPDLGATKRLANRSAVFFIAMVAYTIYGYCIDPSHFFVWGWGLLCLMALVGMVRQVQEQVANRRNRALAAAALGATRPEDIVIESAGHGLVAGGMRTCTIIEGPTDLVGQKLSFAVNNNLIYVGQVNTIASGRFKARLYRTAEGKILAIETVGRVLTLHK